MGAVSEASCAVLRWKLRICGAPVVKLAAPSSGAAGVVFTLLDFVDLSRSHIVPY